MPPGVLLDNLLIRELTDQDSLEELTALLHRAYAALAAKGLKYMATHQGADITRSRIESGVCMVAQTEGRIIGTLTYYRPGRSHGSPFLERPETAHIGQLGVEPEYQGRGVGGRLIDWAEKRAGEDGAGELALDTAETAFELIDWYQRRGYRVVEKANWDCTNYSSVVMSLQLV